MKTKKIKCNLLYILFAFLLFLTGCMVGPDYERPDTKMPQSWQKRYSLADPNSLTQLEQWWVLLNDPVLNKLIIKANQSSLDLKSAYYRILQSRALRDFQAGAWDPTVDLVGSYSRSRESANGALKGAPESPRNLNLFSAGFDASWEIDLFGRIKRSVESSQAELESSIDSYNDILITLYAEVASSYVHLRTTQQRIKFAKASIESQQKTLELTQSRYDAGLAPELDVEQAEINLSNTKAELFSLNKMEIQVKNRIAVLIGMYPEDLNIRASAAIPEIPKTIPANLPFALVRQRPDIRFAERQLASQTARIGFAKSFLYPNISITGSFNMQAMNFSDLFNIGSRSYSFGPGFSWNILDGNRIKSKVLFEEAKTQELKASYEQSVIKAVAEVENTMNFLVQEKKRHQALQSSVNSSKNAVQQVTELYKSGLSDFQNVLDTERTLFQQQDKLAQSKGQIVQDWIGFYKAIGGGWPINEYGNLEARYAEDNNENINR